jgi:hypothetical protein
MLQSKDGHLDPVFDLEFGYRYPDVEKVIGKDTDATVKLLEELYTAKILDSKVFDMEIRCPNCGSPNVSTRYLCPSCGSFHIKKTFLREHLDCGYLGPVVSYGDPMICPKCQQPMLEGSYKNAGSIYECADCKKQIDTPYVNHWCRAKDYNFSFENALYQGKFSYFPTKDTSEDIQRGIIFLSPITTVFEDFGMKRIENTNVIGTSGVELTFDVGYEGAGKKYYVDILQGKELLGELDILREYGKINDSKVEVYTLVSPGMDQSAISMAKSYKMNVCDDPNPALVITKLTEMLKNRGNTMTVKKEAPPSKSDKIAEPNEKEVQTTEKKSKSRWK